jgi:nicotinamide riboside kinase
MIRRVNLFGGASVGKTAMASAIFNDLRKRRVRANLTGEFVKPDAYRGVMPVGFDQMHIFGTQMYWEDVALRNGALVTVSEAPLMQCVAYADKYTKPASVAVHLRNLAQIFEQEYPSLNILLDRADNPYEDFGRFGSEQGAREFDELLLRVISNNVPSWHKVRYDDQEAAIKLVREHLG